MAAYTCNPCVQREAEAEEFRPRLGCTLKNLLFSLPLGVVLIFSNLHVGFLAHFVSLIYCGSVNIPTVAIFKYISEMTQDLGLVMHRLLDTDLSKEKLFGIFQYQLCIPSPAPWPPWYFLLESALGAPGEWDYVVFVFCQVIVHSVSGIICVQRLTEFHSFPKLKNVPFCMIHTLFIHSADVDLGGFHVLAAVNIGRLVSLWVPTLNSLGQTWKIMRVPHIILEKPQFSDF